MCVCRNKVLLRKKGILSFTLAQVIFDSKDFNLTHPNNVPIGLSAHVLFAKRFRQAIGFGIV